MNQNEPNEPLPLFSRGPAPGADSHFVCCKCPEPVGARKLISAPHLTFWCMACGHVLSLKQIDTISTKNMDAE